MSNSHFSIRSKRMGNLKYLWFTLLLVGCVQNPQLMQIKGADVQCEADHADLKVREYFGDYESYYSITAAPLDKVLEYCGGAACLAGSNIIIHYPDTHEYICQQILHELGHVVLREKEHDADYNHTKEDFFGSPTVRGFISYACEAMRTEKLCGEDPL